MKRREKRTIRKSRIKKKRKNTLLIYRLKLIFSCSFLVLLISLIGVITSISFFFKVEAIEICGETRYNNEDVITQSGLKVGDNIFFLDSSKIQNELERTFPYIEGVKVVKRFPNKIVINMRDSREFRVFKSDLKYVIVNSYGKVLEISDKYDGNLLLIEGLECNNLEVGSQLGFSNENSKRQVENIIEIMENNGLSKITYINFKNLANILVKYDNRIKMKLGLYDHVDYKIRTASEIILNNIGENEKGELDLSLLVKDGKSYFTPL